jgi:hypothetical protein
MEPGFRVSGGGVEMLFGDRWDGVLNHDWRIEHASSADFEQALDRLDAKVHTLITVQREGEQHLAIGGGAGQYVVYATFDNEQFWSLLRALPATGTVMLNAGAQEGDYPASQVVTMAQARSAGLVFLATGELDPSQRWEEN